MMNTDPTSVAAVVRMLPDPDLARLVSMVTPEAQARVLRLLPDAALVELIEIARDADHPAHAAPPVAAPAAPRRPANRTSRRTDTAPLADVAIVCRLIWGLMPRGTVTRSIVLQESSGADWLANGWGPERVKAALATGLEHGSITMHGRNRGAHYTTTEQATRIDGAPPAEPSDPPREGAPEGAPEGSPVEAVIQ